MSILTRRRGAAARRRGGDFVAALWDVTKPPTSESYIQRVSGTSYRLYQKMGRTEYLRTELVAPTGAFGGYTAPVAMGEARTIVPAVLVDDTDASMTWTGAGWTTYLGQHRSSTTGDYVEWVTPANTVAVSIAFNYASNCGYGKVSIDGDPTSASELPTAQAEVDAGRLAATALTTGGGTLNPTDRVLDFSANPGLRPYPNIALDLPQSAHTVKIEVSGYKRAAASDYRILVNGMYYSTPDMKPDTAGVTLQEGYRVYYPGTSTQEFAYQMKINTVAEWIGGPAHGNQSLVSMAITVDGTPVTMTDGQIIQSTSAIVVDTVSQLHHSESVTPIADTTTTYTLNEDGFRVQHSTEWLGTYEPMAAYPAMLTLTNLNTSDARYPKFDRGGGSAYAGDYSLTLRNERELTLGTSDTMWVWTSGGRFVGIGRLADPATSLQGSIYAGTGQNFVADRAEWAKLYWTLLRDPTMPDVTNGTTWAADTTYRWAAVTDADAVCSRS